MAVAPDETAAEVTAAEVNVRAIWDVVARIGAGRVGTAYVVDSNDRLIAHPDLRLVLAKARPLRRADRSRPPGRRAPGRAGRADVHDRRGRAGRPGARRVMRRSRRSAGSCSSSSRSRTRSPRCVPRRCAASSCSRWVFSSPCWRASRWPAGWSRRSAGCRKAQRASARASSITASRSAPATSSRRSPTSSTTPPSGCRNHSATSSRRCRRAPRISRNRSSSRPQPPRCSGSSAARRPTRSRCST